MLEEREVKLVVYDPTVRVELEGIGQDDVVMIHVKSKLPFTKGLYERWLLDFEDVRSTAFDMGYDFIMASHKKPDTKVKKFWEMFGFEVISHGDGMIAFIPTEV